MLELGSWAGKTMVLVENGNENETENVKKNGLKSTAKSYKLNHGRAR